MPRSNSSSNDTTRPSADSTARRVQPTSIQTFTAGSPAVRAFERNSSLDSTDPSSRVVRVIVSRPTGRSFENGPNSPVRPTHWYVRDRVDGSAAAAAPANIRQ